MPKPPTYKMGRGGGREPGTKRESQREKQDKRPVEGGGGGLDERELREWRALLSGAVLSVAAEQGLVDTHWFAQHKANRTV